MGAASRRLVESLSLRRHPEGGWFAETYRAAGRIPGSALPRHGSARAYATSILFLLERGEVSRLHRLKSDELWFHHAGGPLTVVEIRPGGRLAATVLGPGGSYQHAVKAGAWFGAFPAPGTDFALVGCAVAPGFDFADFELASRSALSRRYPRHASLIARLTPAP